MTAQELKNSILMRAVQGKLVPQDPNDEPASVLLAKIRAEKERMMKEGMIKKEPISEIHVDPSDNQHYEKIGKTVKCIEDEIPFKIPESWAWCRLGSVGNYGNNQSISSDELTLNSWILDLEDIEKESGILLAKHYKTERNSKSTKHIFKKGNVLYSKLRPYLNKVVVADDDGYCTTEILPLDFGKYIIPQYAQLFLMSPYFVQYATACSYGVKMPRLGTQDGRNAFFALPPKNEQIRIVSQILRYNLYITQYGELEMKQHSLNEKVNIELKKSLLQYAIQGKLVPQDPNDEPASVLLERIRAEKQQLIKEGKIKRDKNDSYICRGSDNSYYEKFADGTITDINVPFEIPKTWEWVRLKHIGEIIGGGTPSTNVSEYWDGEIPWLTPADMKNIHNKFIIAGERNITELGLNKSSAKLLEKYSILYSSRAPIGYIGIAQNSITTNQGFKSVSLYIKNMHMYLYYTLIQRTDDIKARATGTTFKEISGTEFGNTLIPLPPIQEQYRSINYLEQLYNLL